MKNCSPNPTTMKTPMNTCIPASIEMLDLQHIEIGSGCVADESVTMDKIFKTNDNAINTDVMKTNLTPSMTKRTIDMAVFSFLFSVAIFCLSVLVFTGKNEKTAMHTKPVKPAKAPVFAAAKTVVSPIVSKRPMSAEKQAKPFSNATKVDMVKVKQPANPNLPFESFGVMVADGVANIRWTDKESKPVTYMVEKSEDGTNYEIYSVTDGAVAAAEPSEQTFNQADADPGQYYRLLKIVHGGAVYEGNARGVIKTKQADIASIQSHNTTSVLAFVQAGR